MVVPLTLSENEYKFFAAYAEEKKVSLSEFFLRAAMEQIETEDDLRLYEQARADYDADPISYSHEEVKKMFGISK